MADSYLILLDSGTKNPRDFQLAICTIRHFVQAYNTSVLSSLAKTALEILFEAQKEVQFPAALCSSWSPQRTDEVTWRYQVQQEEDAQCWAQELGFDFVAFPGLTDMETEEQYITRIKHAIDTVKPGYTLVLLPNSVITTVITHAIQQGSQPPHHAICYVLQLGATVTSLLHVEQYEHLKGQLGVVETEKPKQPADKKTPSKLNTSEESKSIPKESDFSIWKTQFERQLGEITAQLERKNTEIDTLQASFTRQKTDFETINVKIANLEATLEQKNTENVALKEQLSRKIGELEEIFNGLKTEMDKNLEIINIERGKTAENQKELFETQENRINDRIQSIETAIYELKNSVLSQKPANFPENPELVPANPVEMMAESEFLVTIQRVFKDNGVWLASIVAKDNCLGYFCINQGPNIVGYTELVNFSVAPMNLDLSGIVTLERGQKYEFYVSLEGGRKVSNDYSLETPATRSFEETLVYQKCGNVQEIADYLRGHFGEPAVALFWKLACEWANEDERLLPNFVQIIVGSAWSEEEARSQLQTAGVILA